MSRRVSNPSPGPSPKGRGEQSQDAGSPFPPREGGRGVRLLPLLLLAAGCASKSEQSSTRAEPLEVAVNTVPLRVIALPRSVLAVGTLFGFEEVTLAPKADGRVVAARAETGDVVLPGQVLLDLDPIDQQLAVAEAKEAFLAELAKLALVQLPVAELDAEAVPTVRRAAVAVDDARRKQRQKKDLLARGAGSTEDVEIAETDLKLAEATKAAAITDARSTLAMARLRKASLEVAEQRLRDCRLFVPEPPGWRAWAAAVGPGFAPLRYTVAQRMVAEGEMLRAMPDTKAFKLVLDHVLKLRAAVPERYTPDVLVGSACEVSVEAYPDRIFPGRVARISPTVDTSNRTFQVEIEVPNAMRPLKAGGFAKVAIRTRTDAAVKVVPPGAVVTYAGVTKIFVVRDGRARSIEVRTGTRERDWVEVVGDVPADAQVVVSGLTQLADGTPVRPEPTGRAP